MRHTTHGGAPREGRDFHAANAALHARWEELTAALESCTDRVQQRRMRRQRDKVLEDFVASNQGLVGDYAKRFINPRSRDHAEDFRSAGIIGLLEAFQKWDPSQGTFGTFSRSYIAGRVNREVATVEHPEISYGDSTAAGRVRASETVLTERLGRTPSDAELAVEAGYTTDLVRRVRLGRPASLDVPVGEGDATLGDLVAVEGSRPDLGSGWDHDDCDHGDLSSKLVELEPLSLFCVLRRTGLDGGGPSPRNVVSAMTGVNREKLRKLENRAFAEVGVEPDA